jgi:hypothetical protein
VRKRVYILVPQRQSLWTFFSQVMKGGFGSTFFKSGKVDFGSTFLKGG